MALDTQAVARLTGVEVTALKRIVVRAPNWVGDAVMALPFFAALRQGAPQSEIVCLCRSNIAALYRDVPTIDRVLELDQSRGADGWRYIRYNATRVRAERFDAGFCLPTSFGSALMLWLARVPERYGHAADGRRMLLTRSIPYGPNGQRPHRTDGYLSLLQLVSTDSQIHPKLAYHPGAAARAVVDDIWARHNLATVGTILAIAPSAAQPNKSWMPERFAQIARRWLDLTQGAVLLLGGTADMSCCRTISERVGSPQVLNLAGQGDLPVAGESIRRAVVFLGNDSGLAHLAAAVGTPTIVISGPGDPSEVAPYSICAETIKHPLFCSPCYKNYCWRKDKPLECLTAIDVEQVWPLVTRVIGRRNTG